MQLNLLDQDNRIQSFELRAEIAAQLIRLPEALDLYFLRTPRTSEFDLRSLIATRVREDAVVNANRLMIRASKDQVAKRAPISLRVFGDHLLVSDGNSTFVNAVFSGWSTILGEIEGA